MYSKEDLRQGLHTCIFGCKLFVYDSIDSTNSCAKVLASAGIDEGAVVISDYQTEGRGRLGRIWQAASGTSLLFSTIIRPTLEVEKVGLLPFFASLGVAQALEAVTGVEFECKWPNDVLINKKKCCGILMESSFQHNMLDCAVIGIGLNVNQQSFDPPLEGKATSLRLEFGKEFDRKEIFRQILTALEVLYKEVKIGNLERSLREWKSRTTMIGKQVTLLQAEKEFQGQVVALAADGGLVLATPDGQHVFYGGDVTIIKQD